MNSSIPFYTMNFGMARCTYKGVTDKNFQIKMYLSPFIFANSADPDGMPCMAFHLGLFCLPKCTLWGFQHMES